MRFYILICVALIAMAAGYSGLFKKKFAMMMPLSVFTSILILYVAGLTAHMKIGTVAFLGVSGLVFLAGITKSIARREMKLFVANVLNFGFVVFLALLGLIYFMTDGRLLSRFDEFTHWGLTVKNYVIFDGFANVPGSTTHGAGYQPGISLFCYLFTSLREQVNECDMLKGIDVFVVAMLLPVFRRVTWKRFVIGIILIPVVLFAPWLFAPTILPYNNLLIDCAMAVTFAFLLYHYFTNGQSKTNYFMMGMGSAVLVLIRPGSEAFALMILIMIIVDVIFFERDEFKTLCKKAGWIMPAFYVLITVASWLSWRLFTTANKMMQVFDYIDPSGQEGASSGSITQNFFAAMTKVPEKAAIRISFVAWIFVFLALSAFIVLLSKGAKQRFRNGLFSLLVIGGYLVYAGALLYMYHHLFSEYEALNLASLSRYMYTFILGAVLFYLYMIIESVFARFGGSGNILILIPVALILLFTPWKQAVPDMFTCKETVQKTISDRAEYYKLEEFAQKMDYKKDRVYFIAQNSNGYEYQVSYYLATPVSLSYDYEMGWSLGFPYSDKDVWTLNMTAEEWEKALIAGKYTHVYLHNVDRQFRSLYGSLFEYETAISSNSAFAVTVQNGHVVLKREF